MCSTLRLILPIYAIWQELLEKSRPAAAAVGLPIRPCLELDASASVTERSVVPMELDGEAPATSSPVRSPSSSARVAYTPGETLFLRTRCGEQGVLQVHRVSRRHMLMSKHT